MGFFDFIFQHSKKEKNTSLKIPVPNKFIHTNHDLFSLIPADVLSLLYIQENIKHNKCSEYEMYTQKEPSLIDLSYPIDLDVSKEDCEQDLGYYPSYERISAKERYIYLNWLRNISNPIPIGYVFIFYYGLERQLLFGKFNQAFDMIIRLQKYHNNSSFIAYSTDALLISALYHKDYNKLKYIKASNVPGKIKILISFINKQPITTEMLISIRKDVGFMNDRYIKICPELFSECLKQNINKTFNSNYFPLTEKDFQNTSYCTLALANTSLGPDSRFANAPDITTNPDFCATVYKLLSETHEDVKRLRKKKTT